MLFDSMAQDAIALERDAMQQVLSSSDWPAWSRRLRGLWLDTLGLDPDHLACELDPRVTAVHDEGDVRVENVHFQVAPGSRIPGNLWLPRGQATGGKHPCIVYLCGHTPAGKWWYQHHGRWFAQQGYACLVLDAIQTGESQGVHHGTFWLNRWHWISLGYSPAAVEVQAARRALDYLATRADCDASRCGITGISGGATMALFAAAADERFAAVVPHCVAGSVAQLVAERSQDSHCDCATWVNRHRLGLAHIAALVAPRPLLMSFSCHDALCTPQAMRDLVAGLAPLWQRLGKPGLVQTSEDDIPHAYSDPICRRILQWMNAHLLGRPEPISDAQAMPFQSRYVEARPQVTPTTKLCAYVDPHDPPRAQRMAEVDRQFIAVPGRPAVPADVAEWTRVAGQRLAALRQVTFRDADAAAKVQAQRTWALGAEREGRFLRMTSFEAGPALSLTMEMMSPLTARTAPVPHLVGPCLTDAWRTRVPSSCGAVVDVKLGLGVVHVRGSAQTALGDGTMWFVRRMYPMLGQSLPERQTMDLLRGLHLARRDPTVSHLAVFGSGAVATCAVYAALLGPVDELVLDLRGCGPSAFTHHDGGPEYPGILRVGDLVENLALFFPRPITFVGEIPWNFDWLFELYAALGRREALRVVPTTGQWTPAPNAGA
jgi:cephalosporin-C deacetylase-like acetyl esterase